MMARVPSTEGLQPEIVPSVVANMKTLEPVLPFAVTLKPVPAMLKTSPVGEPCSGKGLSAGLAGILTTSPSTCTCGCEVLYSVLVPLPWVEIQNGLVPLAVSPQALTELALVT